jgi:catalase
MTFSIKIAIVVAGCVVLNTAIADLHPFESLEPDEQKNTAILVQAFTVKAGKTHLRGTHSKGICADAKFTVDNINMSKSIPAGIRARLKTGIFAQPNVYPARVRFANAKGEIQNDTTYDPRALSLVVDLDHGEKTANKLGVRQDFVLQNAPIFPIPSLKDFALLVLPPDKAPALTGLSAEEIKQRFGNMLGLAATFPKDIASYRIETYWSGTAFALGNTEAVKYKVTPCSHNQEGINTDPAERLENYLQEDIKKHLDSKNKGKQSCFVFSVQLLDAEKMTHQGKALKVSEWVEDPTLVWDETQAPFYPVAKITLKKNSAYTPAQCDVADNMVSVMKNTLPEHKGIGRINRGRSAPEEASALARTHAN